MEKRIPVAIVVHLARAEDHTAAGAELTFTDNISAHGACVISSRPWKSGEVAEVTSLNDRITLRGKVAYCAKREESRYYVGLCFNEQEVTWNPNVKCRQSAEADDLDMGQLATQDRHRHRLSCSGTRRGLTSFGPPEPSKRLAVNGGDTQGEHFCPRSAEVPIIWPCTK